MFEPLPQNPYADKPETDKPETENGDIRNNGVLETTELRNNVSKGKKRFSPPHIEDIEKQFLSKDLSPEVAKKESQRFFHFYESKNWYVGKNKMQKWKSAVANWVLNMDSTGTAYRKLSDNELLKEATSKGFRTAGLTREQLISKLEAA